jgi:tocopherol cyclase
MAADFLNRLKVLWTPEAFQGWGRRKRYFEGWYFKLVSADEASALAVIPGLAYDERGEGHAFVQVLDGRRHTASYHRMALEAFQPDARRFALRLGDNYFSAERLELNLPELQGSLTLAGRVPWPVSAFSPGIMGWYAFVPFMECYHGIVSMDSALSGTLVHHGQEQRFDGGRAYLEKDWGRSFPSSWIWMQSNHFEQPGVSFKASVARIPWLGSAFVGFIAGLWLNGTLYRFTTYTGARLVHSSVDGDTVQLQWRDRRHKLEVIAVRSEGGDLVSPVLGAMTGRVNESMSARIALRLSNISGKLIWEGEGRSGGLEVAGPYQELLVEGGAGHSAS